MSALLLGRLGGGAELLRGGVSGADQRAGDEAAESRGGGGHALLRRSDGRVRVGRRRPVDLDRVVDRRAPEDLLLRASDARMPDADRPRVDDLAELLDRAVRVRLRPLAAELVEAVAEAVPLVPELLREAAGVEVRAARAVLVDRAPVREFRTS